MSHRPELSRSDYIQDKRGDKAIRVRQFCEEREKNSDLMSGCSIREVHQRAVQVESMTVYKRCYQQRILCNPSSLCFASVFSVPDSSRLLDVG